MNSLRSRAVVYGLIIVLGLLSALPNVLPASLNDNLPGWYTDSTVSLGLDLRGGSHLLLEADVGELVGNELDAIAGDLASELRAANVGFSGPQVDSGQVRFEFRDAAELTRAAELAHSLARDSSGGSRRFDVETADGALSLQLSSARRDSLTSDAVERSLQVVRQRLDESGLVEPSITRQGETGILVQMPGVADPAEIRRLLGTTAKMSFHWAADRGSASAGASMTLPDAEDLNEHRIERAVALEGKHIRDARMGFHAETREPIVHFVLDGEGARQFAQMTRDNVGRPLAIVLDDKVITAPVIRDVIAGGRGEISGQFSAAEASQLALLLRAGALPTPLKVIEERTVGPDTGSDAISMGLYTGLLGAALVVAFLLGLYGRWGLIACAGLAVNVSLLFGALTLLGATLTLPGIAGIILTIGMAVDANILINERIREESRRGESAAMALREGFDKAYRTILDANLTTLIAVSLLFLVGSGPVRGFAVTIGIGLLTSLFSAIAVTRTLMEWRVRKRPREPLDIAGFAALDRLSARGINFMRGRVAGLVASAILSVAAILLFAQPGLRYGVDFTGGTLVEVQAESVTVEDLRPAFESHGLANATLQESGDGGHFLVRLPVTADVSSADEGQVDELKTAVRSVEPDAEFPRVDMVGPKVSGGFADATLAAIILAGAGMLAYLWLRFESHFALAATLTIALDLTKTIGFFALTGVEFNLTAVAALLALIGYSINDKVVVFDRVRENLRLTPDKPMLQLLNESIGSTLTRTIFTSLTTFLALLPMGVAGGMAVASFALPMLFGIVIGTSSSVLIASPILYYLGQWRSRKGMGQLRPTAEQMREQLDALP